MLQSRTFYWVNCDTCNEAITAKHSSATAAVIEALAAGVAVTMMDGEERKHGMQCMNCHASAVAERILREDQKKNAAGVSAD